MIIIHVHLPKQRGREHLPVQKLVPIYIYISVMIPCSFFNNAIELGNR